MKFRRSILYYYATLNDFSCSLTFASLIKSVFVVVSVYSMIYMPVRDLSLDLPQHFHCRFLCYYTL